MTVSKQTLRALVVQLPVDPDLELPTSRLGVRRAAVLVAVGGAVGSVARAGVTAAVPVATHGWPTDTLTVNVVGSALLGLLLALLHERPRPAWWARPLLGTGFCGGFTTFSTFAVEVATRAGHGRAPLALGYVAVSVLLSLLAALLALVAVRVGVRLADRRSWHRRLGRAAELAIDEDAA